MILIDHSMILIASAMAQSNEFEKGGDTKRMASIIRHTVLNSILTYKKQFGPKYGKVVICYDGGKNWRKDVFPTYKFHRKSDREASTTDWKTIFDVATDLRAEIEETFPFCVVREDTAEADDVIAVLVKYSQDSETETVGFFEEPQKMLVISSDGDFKQLYKYRNYAQWSPQKKKAVERPEKTFLLEKCIRGDAGDAVPSVLCPDDFFVNKAGRATPVTKKIIEKFSDEKNLNELELRNLQRNKTLIDFEYIPKNIEEKILKTYKESVPKVDKNAVFEYFVAHRLRTLTNSLQDFF